MLNPGRGQKVIHQLDIFFQQFPFEYVLLLVKKIVYRTNHLNISMFPHYKK